MKFQAKIPFVDALNRPDDYSPKSEKRPADKFVVSRTREGVALSLYADMSWDRSPYDPDGRSMTLSFQFWKKDDEEATPNRIKLVDEIRWLTFVLLYLKSGPSISNRTLQGYVFVLRSFACYCESSRQSIKEALARTESVLEFIDSAPEAAARFVAIVRMVWRLGEEVTGMLVPGRTALDSLDQQAKKYRESMQQHPPLPTRIYAVILENLNSEFESILLALDGICSLASECFMDPLVGMPISKQRVRARELRMAWVDSSPTFDELIEKYQLFDFWNRIGNVRDRKGMMGILVHIQLVCSLQIQAFTGMRRSEVQSLPIDCLQQVVRMGNVRYIVRGRVTKLTRGRIKEARWVTSKRGKDAVEVAQRIAKLIYDTKRINAKEVESLKLSSSFLFVSPIYLWGNARGGKNNPSQLAMAPRFDHIRRVLEPIVESVDVAELVQIDPHRHWHLEDGTKVGKPWRFTTHQFRRSLALYAQKSGLVSLPSLKQQLQHITQEMSLYYSRGANRAIDVTGPLDMQNRFKDEWLDAQPLSQYLSYVIHVLSAREGEIFGGHADWMILSQRNGRTKIFENRDTTLKQFKLGKIAYTITPVGGCTNPAPCEKNPIDVLHEQCIIDNCKHLAGNIEKLKRMISIKSKQIEAMRKTSRNLPEIVHEAAELEKLVAAMEVIQVKSTKLRNHGKPAF